MHSSCLRSALSISESYVTRLHDYPLISVGPQTEEVSLEEAERRGLVDQVVLPAELLGIRVFGRRKRSRPF